MKNANARGQRGGYGVGGTRGGFSNPNPLQYQSSAAQQSIPQNAMYNPMAAPSYYGQPAPVLGQPTQLQMPSALPTAPQSHGIPGVQFTQQSQQAGFTAQNTQNTPGNKRPRNNLPRPPAAPAVPSFGMPLPLPVKPCPAADTTTQPALKKRKYNQLGLTPKTLDPESSETEDDADEETKLTPNIPLGGLQITYRGRTSALQSADDIAKWIEERKKRFPTMAKVEEAKKEAEAKKAEREAMRKQKEEARRLAMEKRGEKQKEKKEKQARENENDGLSDRAAKARLRAEKLRKKLMKEEKKLAEVEAAEKAKLSTGEPIQPNGSGGDDELQIPVDNAADKLPTEPSATQKSDNSVAKGLDALVGNLEQKPAGIDTEKGQQNGDVDSDPTSSSGPTDDETSSSGSDTLSDDSESDSDSDGAPEELTSKRTQPDRVPPPPRVDPRKSKKICHQFAKTGRCNKGDQCRFLHERPERQPKKTAVAPQKRKSLFQAVGFSILSDDISY